jgi:stage III sporulation protein AG
MPSKEALTAVFKRYKFVLIVIAAGLILLAMPSESDKSRTETMEGVLGTEEDFSVEALEEKLSAILSRIEGAGKVSVMLTVKSGTERILATDLEASQSGTELDRTEETVILSKDAGEEVVLIGQNYPTFQGALVVCPGGGDPQIQLEITRALAALTGLGAGRITVCKGS